MSDPKGHLHCESITSRSVLILLSSPIFPSDCGNIYCISPNVGRYFGLVTGPPPPPAMEAMEAAAMEAAAATERFRRLLDAEIHFGIYLARFG